MTPQQINEILNTRLNMAREEGNPTETSLLYELIKIVEEYKELQDKMRSEADA
jgi:hypothetical protein